MPTLRERIAAAAKAFQVQESIDYAATYADPDEAFFRRLTGETRDLSPVTHERARAISRFLQRQNPLARRLSELMLDFVVGDGLEITSENEDADGIIEEWWTDPMMRMDLRHREIIQGLGIDGEIFLRAYVKNGVTRFGFIDPARVVEVKKDPDNAFVDKEIHVARRDAAGGVDVFQVMQIDYQEDGMPTYEGDVFFYSVNRPIGATRGTPDTLSLADWIDAYDQLLFNSIDRSALMNSFVWDVTLRGADNEQVSEWVERHGASPRPGTVRVHNDAETWNAVTPSLGAAEQEIVARTVKNLILGGAGIPEAWFADGDSANRATVAEQGDPTYRMLTARQRLVRGIFEDLVTFVLVNAIEAGRLSPDEEGEVPEFDIIFPDPSVEDTKGISTVLPSLVNALMAAKSESLISTETSRKVFLSLVKQMGMDIDLAEEVLKIEEEKAAADAEAQAMGNMGANPMAQALAGMQKPGQQPGQPAQPGQPQPQPGTPQQKPAGGMLSFNGVAGNGAGDEAATED